MDQGQYIGVGVAAVTVIGIAWFVSQEHPAVVNTGFGTPTQIEACSEACLARGDSSFTVNAAGACTCGSG